MDYVNYSRKVFNDFLNGNRYRSFVQSLENETDKKQRTNIIRRFLLFLIRMTRSDDFEEFEEFELFRTRKDEDDLLYFHNLIVQLCFDVIVKYEFHVLIREGYVVCGKMFLETVSEKLKEFHERENERGYFHEEWKGANYYYEKIYGVPMVFCEMFDEEEYKERKKYMDELKMELYHHPLSLNGHLVESWEEMKEQGIVA